MLSIVPFSGIFVVIGANPPKLNLYNLEHVMVSQLSPELYAENKKP